MSALQTWTLGDAATQQGCLFRPTFRSCLNCFGCLRQASIRWQVPWVSLTRTGRCCTRATVKQNPRLFILTRRKIVRSQSLVQTYRNTPREGIGPTGREGLFVPQLTWRCC